MPEHFADDHIYTQADIDQAIGDYANHHEVEVATIIVDRITDNGVVVGFRLSLDGGDRSHGCDEKFGRWE